MIPPLVDELLERWEAARDAGTPIRPEDLCRDCPGLLPEMRRQIGLLERFHAWADTEPLPRDKGPVPQPTATAATRYAAERFHARGGLGEVHLGRDRELGRAVALKRMQ